MVKLLSRPIFFWSMVVKPYLQSKLLKSDLEIDLKPSEFETKKTV